MLNCLLNTRKLVPVSPGPLLSSTLALVVFWAMRRGHQRRLGATRIPTSLLGNHCLRSRSSSPRTLPQVKITSEQPTEGSVAYYEWILATSTRFHGQPWLLQRSGRPNVLVVSSPEALEEIQRTFATHFEKVECETDGLVHDVHGGGLAVMNAGNLRPSIKTQRRLATTVVSSPRLRQQASVLVSQHIRSLLTILDDAAERTTAFDTNASLDMTKLMHRFAMEVFTELGFGLQLRGLHLKLEETSEFASALHAIQQCLAERANRSTVTWKLERLLNVCSEAALRRSVNIVHTITVNAVAGKRRERQIASTSSLNRSVDMLDLLLSQKCHTQRSKDPEFLAEFVLKLVMAARDSTAHTLSKCLQSLAQHPEEQDKLYIELTTAKDEGRDLHSVARLEAVVKETLRLYPAHPFIRRRAVCDTVLTNGTFVPKGMEVAMDLYTMARREDVWGPESAQFRPQRWLDTASGRLRPVSSYKFNAFLGGPRACVGATIALTEIKTVIASVVSNVHLEYDQRYDQDKNRIQTDRIQVRRRSGI